MSSDVRAINEVVQRESAFIDPILHEVRKVIVGQDEMVERLFIGLLTGGHILLEGVTGLAKTLAVKTLCRTISAKFSRIQFTPDLLPADVVGTVIYNQQGAVRPRKDRYSPTCPRRRSTAPAKCRARCSRPCSSSR